MWKRKRMLEAEVAEAATFYGNGSGSGKHKIKNLKRIMVRDGILRGRGLVVLIKHPSFLICLNPLALYLFTAFSLSHSFTWLSSAHDTPTFVCPFPAFHTSCRTKDTEVENFCYWSVLVGRAGRSKNGRRHF